MKRRHKKDAISHKRIVEMYEVRAKGWGINFLRRNHWKIRSICDLEDIKQEAFLGYMQVCSKHFGKTEEELFKLYKVRLYFLLQSRSRSCFPNPYSYVKDVGQLVIDISSDAFRALEDALSVPGEALSYLELLDKIPMELQEAFVLVVRDVLSLARINQRVTRTVKGRRRCEPLNLTLARLTNVDKSRDILKELELAMSNTNRSAG